VIAHVLRPHPGRYGSGGGTIASTSSQERPVAAAASWAEFQTFTAGVFRYVAGSAGFEVGVPGFDVVGPVLPGVPFAPGEELAVALAVSLDRPVLRGDDATVEPRERVDDRGVDLGVVWSRM
jgi:hypothetical protein